MTETSATAVREPTVSVVVPVYHNAATLPVLHDELTKVLTTGGYSYELIFVDDAGTDDSGPILGRLAEQDSHVRVITLAHNAGQQSAVLTGLARAQGRWAVVMDADLQDPPAAIPVLLAELERSGAAVVFAKRQGGFQSGFRMLTSRLYKGLLRILFKLPAKAGLFLAMNRQMIDRLTAFDVRRPFILPLIGCSGLRVTAVAIQRQPRQVGQSDYSAWKRLKLGCLASAQSLCWRIHSPPTRPGLWRDRVPRR